LAHIFFARVVNTQAGAQMIASFRALAFVTLCAFAAFVAGEQPKILFEERFTEKLEKDWVWLREDSKYWRIENETLAVVANGGSMWRSLNNYKNILFRPAPADAKDGFQFEALLDNEPKQQFEHAGIACRYDDDNYLILNKEYLGKQELLMISEANTAPTLPGLKKAYEPREVWLRLTIHEGRAVGHYRERESDPWLLMGEMPLPPSDKPLQIGLVAGLGKDGREAKFRSFRVMELARRTN
jgi:regulation of enolase protein 1 (concanavalin A-like superfamily)